MIDLIYLIYPIYLSDVGEVLARILHEQIGKTTCSYLKKQMQRHTLPHTRICASPKNHHDSLNEMVSRTVCSKLRTSSGLGIWGSPNFALAVMGMYEVTKT